MWTLFMYGPILTIVGLFSIHYSPQSLTQAGGIHSPLAGQMQIWNLELPPSPPPPHCGKRVVVVTFTCVVSFFMCRGGISHRRNVCELRRVTQCRQTQIRTVARRKIFPTEENSLRKYNLSSQHHYLNNLWNFKNNAPIIGNNNSST